MKRSSDLADEVFLFLCLVFLLSVCGQRLWILIAEFVVRHRYLSAAMVTAAILGFFLVVRKRFVQANAAKDLESDVLSGIGEESVFAGISSKGQRVYVRPSFRRMHVQVVGTTNAGKTESVILPWAIDDIKRGRGLLVIDGKSDRSLLDKLYAYAKQFRREKDVRILSLCSVSFSHTFNPFAGGSPLEITERVFKALSFENEYFKSLQYEALLHVLLIFESAKIAANPLKVIEALRSPQRLKELAASAEKSSSIDWVREFLALSREDREQRTSGLVTQLQVFAVGETASVFNAEKSDIELEKALEEGQIVYCQLPVLKIPTLGKITGKMILQALQSAVASRHLGKSSGKGFFSVYLDDFTEYLTESFVSLLNKSRSANVSIVFAHQALGDLAVLGDAVKNTILTNANLKVFMRTNEPESAEYFAGVVGTSRSMKVTERQKRGFFGTIRTGDGSVRDVEEYRFHPNLFKQELGVGEAVMVLPHPGGSLPVRLKFRRSPDLDQPSIPAVPKEEPRGLPTSSISETNFPSAPKAVGKLDHMNPNAGEGVRKEAA